MDGALNLPQPPKLDGGGAPPPVAPGGGSGGPMAAPMQTPQSMPGIEKGARIQVQVASQALQRELPHFPLDSEQFKALSKALEIIQKAFGKTQDEDRKPFNAEIMNMLSAVGPGSQTPGQQAMAGAKPPGTPAAPPAMPPQM